MDTFQNFNQFQLNQQDLRNKNQSQVTEKSSVINKNQLSEYSIFSDQQIKNNQNKSKKPIQNKQQKEQQQRFLELNLKNALRETIEQNDMLRERVSEVEAILVNTYDDNLQKEKAIKELVQVIQSKEAQIEEYKKRVAKEAIREQRQKSESIQYVFPLQQEMQNMSVCELCPYLLKRLQSCSPFTPFEQLLSSLNPIEILMITLSLSLYPFAFYHLIKTTWSPTVSNRSLSLLLLFQVFLCNLLKISLRMYRPVLSCDSHKYGMPSAHGCCAVILLMCLQKERENLWKRWMFLGYTIGVMYSRYYLIYHSPAQIIIGGALGYGLSFFFQLIQELFIQEKKKAK